MSGKIDLKNFELVDVDMEWLNRSNAEPIVMLPAFDDFLSELKRQDKKGYYQLFAGHVHSFAKAFGEPAFVMYGKHPWKTWVFKLTDSEHLVIHSDNEGGTSFAYAGAGEISQNAAEKVKGILLAIKDYVPKRREPDYGLEI